MKINIYCIIRNKDKITAKNKENEKKNEKHSKKVQVKDALKFELEENDGFVEIKEQTRFFFAEYQVRCKI